MRFCMVLRIHVCCRGEESVVMLPVVVLVCLISHDGNHLYVAEALIPDFCVLCRCLHKHGCCKSGVCCKNRETQVKLAVYAQANKHALQTPGGSRNQEIRNYGVGACACDCAVRVAEASNALSGSRTHLLYMYGVRGDFFFGMLAWCCEVAHSFSLQRH